MGLLKTSRTFFFYFSLILFVSCSNKDVSIPPEILPQDSMIQIMANVHLAESRLLMSGRYVNNEALKSAYIQKVLSESNISAERFQSSFAYYTSRPELFSEMYNKVMEEISRRQAEKK